MESRPTTAFILTLLGGLFIVLGAITGVLFLPTGYVLPDFSQPFLITAAVAGGVLIIAAVLLYYRPVEHVAWGVIGVVFSVVSGVGLVTGYFALFGIAGLVIGLVGGSMAISWRTTPVAPATPYGAVRMCHGCGRYVPLAYPFCAFCGTPAPVFHPPAGGGTPPPGTPPQP